MPMPQKLDLVSDNDHDEPSEGNPQQNDSEQIDYSYSSSSLPEEEKKEGALSNLSKHQKISQKVESEVKVNMKEAEHFVLQQLGFEELDNPVNDLQGQHEQLDGGNQNTGEHQKENQQQEQLGAIEEELDGNDDESNESVSSLSSSIVSEHVKSSNESVESEQPPEVPLEGPIAI